eukprot:m.27615 g.27615  ORF g.27615 m.27615 type:complete len:387 (+) comp9382_c0_seq1:11-1171(+)
MLLNVVVGVVIVLSLVAASGGATLPLDVNVVEAPLLSRAMSRENEFFLSGAGMNEVNGYWQRYPEGLHNNNFQYEHVHNDTSRFLMFVHKTEKGQWWNIQEIVRSSGGIERFGQVYYGATLTFDKANVAQLPIEWGSLRGFANPAPVLHDLRVCDSVWDCGFNGNDVCVDFFIDMFGDFEFAEHVLTDKKRIRQCEDNGHWMRDISQKEINQFRDDFFFKGIVSVPNMLKPEVFRNLQAALQQPVHSLFWQASFVDTKTNDAKLVPRHPDNLAEINRNRRAQHMLRDQGKYAYSFTRTASLIPAKYRRFYKLFHGDMRGWLDSNKMQDLLTRITNRKYELSVLFTSRYKAGDFLSPFRQCTNEKDCFHNASHRGLAIRVRRSSVLP